MRRNGGWNDEEENDGREPLREAFEDNGNKWRAEREHEGGARNLRATWIRAAFNPPDELAIMKLGWVRWWTQAGPLCDIN